ncbi:hypothetical protein O3P69_020878 [Scylla paramamosain]|uniref:Uncharacterized protein n=1 Tax=Scylla paramamosain TaxID=85552 RepID=A0AAW0TNZ9_SCYPA
MRRQSLHSCCDRRSGDKHLYFITQGRPAVGLGSRRLPARLLPPPVSWLNAPKLASELETVTSRNGRGYTSGTRELIGGPRGDPAGREWTEAARGREKPVLSSPARPSLIPLSLTSRPVRHQQEAFEWRGGSGVYECSSAGRRGHFLFSALSAKLPVKRLLLRLLGN